MKDLTDQYEIESRATSSSGTWKSYPSGNPENLSTTPGPV